LPKKFGSAKEASFNTKTAISAMNLKFRVTTCFAHMLRTIVKFTYMNERGGTPERKH